MTGTENHLRGLEHQSKNFVEGQTDLLKIRNQEREQEADRKRNRERGDDLATAAENARLVPRLRGALEETRRQKDNAEDMIVDVMVQSVAWRKTVSRLAEAWGVPNGAEEVDKLADDVLDELKADTTFVGEMRTWVQTNMQATVPAKVARPRLSKRKLKM